MLGGVGDPPAGVWEAGVEDIEEFAWDRWERCGVVVDVRDDACLVGGVDLALGVVGGRAGVDSGRGGDLGAGMEYSLGIDPPDELIRGDHIRTFQPEESAVRAMVWSGIGELLELRRVIGPMGC